MGDMRLLAGFVCLAAVLFVQSAAGQAEQWLGYHSAREAQQIVGDMGTQNLTLSTDRLEGVELPEFTGDSPLFCKWSSPMVKAGYLCVALDRAHKYGPYDKLFIDSNVDGHLNDETAVSAYRTEQRRSYFGPVKVVLQSEDGPITYHLNFNFYRREDYTRFYVTSGGWYEGAITVAGVKKHCVLIDYNANGTFDDKSTVFGNCDRIRIGTKRERNTRFVGNFIEVDGRLYRPEIAQDGAYIKLAVAEDVQFGTVKLQEQITEFSAGGENGLFTVRPKDGKGQLPVGKYRVDYWQIERKDDKGSTWKLQGRWFGDSGIFEVSEQAETKLEVGEPVISQLQVRKERGRYSFNQELQGQLGERIELTRNGSRPRAPKLDIKNKDKSYERTFSFEYG